MKTNLITTTKIINQKFRKFQKLDRAKFSNVICGIFGELGAGKTALLTCIGYIYLQKNYDIYTDYDVSFEHIRIHSLSELNKYVNIEKDSVFLFDELWLSADSRKSFDIGNLEISHWALQSRKKRMNIFYTAQFPRLVDLRLRTITNYILKPTIISFTYDDKPQLAIIEKFSRNIYGDVIYIGKAVVDLSKTIDFFRTEEIIKPIKTSTIQDKYTRLIENYINDNSKNNLNKLKQSDIKADLVFKEGISVNRANILAKYILNEIKKRKNEEVLLKEKKVKEEVIITS